MAISTNDIIDKFGAADTVTAGGGTSAVTNGTFSAAADAATWTNDDDAPLAVAILKFQYATGTLASAGFSIYCRRLNIDSTNDEPVVDSGYPGHFLAHIPIDTNLAISTDSYVASTPFRLPNLKTSQEYDFFVENNSGVTIAASWVLKIVPISGGPHS